MTKKFSLQKKRNKNRKKISFKALKIKTGCLSFFFFYFFLLFSFFSIQTFNISLPSCIIPSTSAASAVSAVSASATIRRDLPPPAPPPPPLWESIEVPLASFFFFFFFDIMRKASLSLLQAICLRLYALDYKGNCLTPRWNNYLSRFKLHPQDVPSFCTKVFAAFKKQ